MKTTKKILALLLAVCMIAAMMAVPALADTTSLTIDDDGGSYNGYQLLTSTDDGEGHYAYTVNSKYSSILQTAASVTSDAGVVSAIAAMDEATIREFADAVYAAIKTKSLAADATLTGGTAKTVNQGYWLIADVTTYDNVDDVVSLTMLDTAGSKAATMSPKKALPTVTKDADKNTANVGDTITFTVTGKTANYNDTYDTYYFEFVDTMVDLTYVPDSISFAFSSDASATKDNFTVSFDATKKVLSVKATNLSGKVTKDTVITLTYKATLDATAIADNEAENSVKLVYSNDPYSSGKGESTPDGEKVTTYDFDLVKYTVENNTNTLLTGATFQLKSGSTTLKFKTDTNGYYVPSTASDASADLVVTGGKIRVAGLAAGEYTLTETVVPDGYNKADDTTVKLVDKDLDAVLSTDGKAYESGGIAVENSSGTILPETGGVGTTLFIIFGALAVMTAGIFLVTNQRMKKEGF